MFLRGCIFVALIVSLPWLGAILAGRDRSKLLAFPPPLAIPVDYLRVSVWAMVAVLAAIVLIVGSWLRPARSEAPPVVSAKPRGRRRVPLWIFPALVWVAVWWLIAWQPMPGMEWARRYSFFPLWLGFIVAVNGLVELRSGFCLMRRSPGQWLGLFAASAGFWWGFEWLNRFARNWHYLGAENFSAASYAIHATLCFSTVLPAVAAVAELLGTSDRWNAAMKCRPAWPWLSSIRARRLLFAGGTLALLGTGAWPDTFYPTLWLAPLALYLGGNVHGRRAGFGEEIARGDWRRAGTWMLAALVCGGFWEMWNSHSSPKWIYTVPGVDCWHVFEMPLLGYAGYLPFGLECLAAMEWIGGRKPPQVTRYTEVMSQ